MNVYASLVVFATEQKNALVLVDAADMIPSWLMKAGGKESLELVQDGLYNISGISKNWFPNFIQNAVLELDKKDIYILWTIYCSSKFDLLNTNYRWRNISELDTNSKSYSVIRYLHTMRR